MTAKGTQGHYLLLLWRRVRLSEGRALESGWCSENCVAGGFNKRRGVLGREKEVGSGVQKRQLPFE